MFIKNSIFYVQFFNSGILVALASFDSSKWRIPMINQILNGYYIEIDD